MTPRVVVIDIGIGNLTSVANAFRTLPCDVEVAHDPGALAGATHVVLPGVGAFGDGMALLRVGGWIEPLDRIVAAGEVPILGVCLGMQLLAAVGTEHGTHAGLGWLDGRCVRLEAGELSLRIPQIGWNEVQVQRPCSLYDGLAQGTDFYFLHSYVLRPDDDDVITATCSYGTSFAASVHQGNVYGVQFHPEKSQRAGLTLLANFVRDGRECTCSRFA